MVDDRTRTLIRFLDARVDGSGAEGFVCCDAQRRAGFEPERLYSYGDFDLIGYRIDERNQGLPASGGEPWFIATLFYEDGVLEESNSSLDEMGEFLVVGVLDGSLRVTKWADEGTS